MKMKLVDSQVQSKKDSFFTLFNFKYTYKYNQNDLNQCDHIKRNSL
jgi:hypothetical protein